MNRPKFILVSLTAFFLSICSLSAAAQSEPERPANEQSYEVSLHLILASNDAQIKNEIPANLSTVAGSLKNRFGYSSLRLVNTYFGRLAEAGSFEYKSVIDNFTGDAGSRPPMFVDWSVRRVRSASGRTGSPTFSIEAFRFGARVPITITPDGKSALNYEMTGLNLDRLAVPSGEATPIGTLSMPGTNGTLFLVITISPTRN